MDIMIYCGQKWVGYLTHPSQKWSFHDACILWPNFRMLHVHVHAHVNGTLADMCRNEQLHICRKVNAVLHTSCCTYTCTMYMQSSYWFTCTCMQQPACVQLSKQHIMCSMYTAARHFCEGCINCKYGTVHHCFSNTCRLILKR